MDGDTTQHDAGPLPRYLSPEEFSRASGLSLSTVHRYLKSGYLPYLQPAGPRGRILIPADALEMLHIARPDPNRAGLPYDFGLGVASPHGVE